MLLAPRRRLPDSAVDALRRFLRRGVGLLAMLEPGRQSGVEALLAEYGLISPQAVLIDPFNCLGTFSDAMTFYLGSDTFHRENFQRMVDQIADVAVEAAAHTTVDATVGLLELGGELIGGLLSLLGDLS